MKRHFIVLLHLGYWATWLLLLAVVFAALRAQDPNGPSLFTILLASRVGLLSIVPNLIAFYLAYLLLSPHLLERRRIAALIAGGGIGAAGSAALGVLSLYLALGAKQPVLANATELAALMAWLTIVALIHTAIALVMRGFVGWYGDIKVKEELVRKTHEVELALIRSRLDPHFLFNTLNNIDVLIARDPAAASSYLNKLSDLMRFVLYETRAETIPLAAELMYIERYIDLERIRSANPRYVSYELTGPTTGLMIAPMMLIPWIENAFKHAAGTRTGEVITVRAKVEGRSVTFQCSNRYLPGTGRKENRSGLGNELICRRLMLLYPDRHTLEVNDRDDTYTIELKVDLDDDPMHHR